MNKVPLLILMLCTFSGENLPAQTNQQVTPSPTPDFKALWERLSSSVAAMPEGNQALAKSVLTVALERAKACEEASCPEDAKTLMDEIEAALSGKTPLIATPSSRTNMVSALLPPIKVEGNPYLGKLVTGAGQELSRPDTPFPKNSPTVNSFSGLGGETGSRSAGDEMQAWLWLYANPASPLKGDPRVLERFLRVAHAYADAIDVHGALSLAGSSASIEAAKGTPLVGAQGSRGNENAPLAGQGIFDDFAIAPASCALREFAQLYPGLLLPSQKAMWDRAMTTGGAVMWLKAKDRKGTYANIDLALAFELLNFGLYLDNREYLDKSRFLYREQEKILWADGALAYLDHQNESANYHNSDTRDLTRIYEVNGDPWIPEFLKKTEWYGPVTCGKRGEFWTVPSWKDTWNDQLCLWTGGESVAALTGNPYLRGMNDELLTRQADPFKWPTGWYSSRLALPWWRDDVKPLPLPDNYTVLDRNIAGPRSWYGRFNYAASLRPIPEAEPGLATIMGAQVTEPNGGPGQILMGVYPRIRDSKEETTKDGHFNRAAFSWRTHGMKSALVMGRSWSALMADYRLQQYRSHAPGNPVDWQGRQLWLGLPDRIIGLVEVAPLKEGTKAIDVEGVLRLGTGGTVNGKPTKIGQTGTNSWNYGGLSITVHGHNGAKIETLEVPYRVPKFPNTEIRILDGKGAAGDSLPTPYPLSFRQWFVVEIRSPEAKDPASVTRLTLPEGLVGISAAIGSKHFSLLGNPTSSPLHVPSGTPPLGSTLHTQDGRILQPVPPGILINPGELSVLVTSADSSDHAKGWSSYQEMISPKPSSPGNHP